MHLIAPGIATNVAYGTCMLLFGLLILSVRNRKAAARIPVHVLCFARARQSPARAEETIGAEFAARDDSRPAVRNPFECRS